MLTSPGLGPVVLPGREGVHELELAEGRIAAIRPSTAGGGRLCLPALADLHLHADRAYGQGPRPPRSLEDAVEIVQAVRARATYDSIHGQATRLLTRSLAHGALRARTHVDIDDVGGMTPLRAVADAGEALPIELQIVAFASALLDPASPEAGPMLTEAVGLGAGLIGSPVAFFPDPAASIDALLDLAVRLGVPVDVHIDEHLDGNTSVLERLADATIERGLEGRVAASHACALAAVDEPERVIEKLVAARITVLAQPAVNLYLQDRGNGTPRRRGLTLVRELLDAGVPVRFGSDNVGDVFFPYGDGDPLEQAFLAAIAAHVDDEDALLAGICDGRTRVEEGDPADLVLLEATSFREALACRPANRVVFRAGEPLTAARA
jgi:cytosine deaminase